MKKYLQRWLAILGFIIAVQSSFGAATLSPYLMTSGLHPWDSTVTHDLLRTLPNQYAVCSFYYDWWTNGTGNPPGVTTNGPAFFDTLYTLNSNKTMIWLFYGVPTNAITTLVPQLLARYPLIWGVRPLNEEHDYDIVAMTCLLFAQCVTNKPLIGPSFVNDYTFNYMTNLYTRGVFTNLDIIDMHDYFAVPGQSALVFPPWPTNTYPYTHPQDNPSSDITNLYGRMIWMLSFSNLLRTNFPAVPKAMISEYGLYVSNVVDAAKLGNLIRRAGVPVALLAPEGPAGRTNSIPYSHGFYNEDASAVVWSPAILALCTNLTPANYVRWRVGQ